MAAPQRRVGNLPAETTTLIGRRAELERIRQLCGDAGLVTLTGVGGVGKTRLALRAAAQMGSRFPDGSWLVELSPLRHGALLGHAIAEALGLADQTVRPMGQVLTEYLAERRLLLVLDTCEHLVDDCAALAETLLGDAPGLRILATSRQSLDVPGEQVLVVEPLSVPEPAAAGDGDAVALFADRAADVVPGFALTADNRAGVTRLCRRLDGIPLAIELAAVRLGELSVDQLVQRLDDRFALLAAPEDQGLPRHQTLRTAIGWSHELCEPPERLMWARLSVFAGEFDADAAEQVCADRQLPDVAVFGVLYGLVDKSIVVQRQTPVGVRYRLLDTIREYGAAWLRDVGQDHDLERRHRDHYLELARQGDAHWLGPDQVTWYERMTGAHDNLRVALEYCLAERDGQAAQELAGALWFFWHMCGFSKEGRHYLERALALDPTPSPARTKALWACGLIAVGQGDSAAAEALAAEHHRDGALGLFLTMVAAAVRGDLSRTASAAEALLAAEQDGDFGASTLLALLMLAYTKIGSGQGEDAIVVLEDLRARCDQHGERMMRSHGDFFRAQAELARGQLGAARAYGRAALEVKHQLHDSIGVAMAVDLLACTAGAAGQGERAARLLGLAHQVWDTQGLQQAGVPQWIAARQTCEQQAREAIGDQAYQAAFEAGREGDLDAGISYALSEAAARSKVSTQDGLTG
ncbi:MAG TPA: AAA family ATPase [Actinomycetes bacterium]